MIECSVAVTIACPIDQVFAFVADMENDPLWCPVVLETWRTSGAGPGLGARYRVTARPFFIRERQEFETMGFEPPSYLAWTGRSWRVVSSGSYALQPVAGGTRLVHQHKLSLKGLRWLEPLAGGAVRRVDQRQLGNLKQLLESGGLCLKSPRT